MVNNNTNIVVYELGDIEKLIKNLSSDTSTIIRGRNGRVNMFGRYDRNGTIRYLFSSSAFRLNDFYENNRVAISYKEAFIPEAFENAGFRRIPSNEITESMLDKIVREYYANEWYQLERIFRLSRIFNATNSLNFRG